MELDEEPTHWMPLPNSPLTPEKTGDRKMTLVAELTQEQFDRYIIEPITIAVMQHSANVPVGNDIKKLMHVYTLPNFDTILREVREMLSRLGIPDILIIKET